MAYEEIYACYEYSELQKSQSAISTGIFRVGWVKVWNEWLCVDSSTPLIDYSYIIF